MTSLVMPPTHNEESPFGNLITTRRVVNRRYDNHQQKLYNISQRNVRQNNLGNNWTTSTPMYNHLENNAKRSQKQDDRFLAIEHEK